MAVDALFKKYFLVVLLGLIALSAYFEAKGATQLFGAALLTPVASSAPGALAPPSVPVPQREPRTAEPLIERNPLLFWKVATAILACVVVVLLAVLHGVRH